MSLKEIIQEDITKALKKGDSLKAQTLRMLSAAIVNKEKEAGRKDEITQEEMEKVVASEVKKRREAVEAFLQGQRTELAEKEKQEMEILLSYLPEQLSEEEIKQLAKEAIEKTGATTQKDMGKVMAELASKIQGKADGALVARIVKELIG